MRKVFLLLGLIASAGSGCSRMIVHTQNRVAMDGSVYSMKAVLRPLMASFVDNAGRTLASRARRDFRHVSEREP